MTKRYQKHKKYRVLRRLWRRYRRQLRPVLLAGVFFIGLGTSVYALTAAQQSPHVTPPLASQPSAPATKPVVKPKPAAPKPAAPHTPKKPVAKAAPVSTPAPKRAPDIKRSPAAVASTHTSPGSGTSGLTSTSGTPPPATPTPASASTSTTQTSTPPPPSCANTTERYYSSNWAGYFRTGCTFTAVSGAWTVPTPTTTSTTDVSIDAAWIGVGGATTNDLIQVGTEDTVATDGTINVAAFYELLPDMPHYPASIIVAPGDQISASLSEISTNLWSISISDLTSGTSFASTVSYASSHSSVEWIEEDPSYTDGTLVPFDDFGSVNFAGSSSTGNGVVGNLGDASSITLVDQFGRALAVPSAVVGGSSFSVIRR